MESIKKIKEKVDNAEKLKMKQKLFLSEYETKIEQI